MKTIYVDTETSGLHPSTAVILEVAGVYVVDGREVDYYHAVCNPGEEVINDPNIANALAVNKITLDELRQALPLAHVAEAFGRFLIRCGYPESVLLSSFNVAFDAKFLEADPWNIHRGAWGACVMLKAAEAMDPYRKKWPKLFKAAEHFDLSWDGESHRALADARMAFKVDHAIMARAL